MKVQLLFIVISSLVFANLPAQDKPRVVIMTDMTHDDGNSLIRYLYYSHMFETEAIIITNQLPDFPHDDPGPWNKGTGILRAYEEEYLQLKKHHEDYPSPVELFKVTKRGRGAIPIIWLTHTGEFKSEIAGRYVESSWGEIRYGDWIGEGTNPNGEPKDSEGSEFLQTVFEEEDDRPIFVQMWGGPITFVQALYRYRQKHSREEFRTLMDKLHVFGILLQDITFDYMINLDSVQALDCMNMGDVMSQYEGERARPRWLLVDGGHFWYYVWSRDPDYVKPMVHQEVNGHGPMSEIYDHGGEGDSPSFLYLISAQLGLNDPLEPVHGSWGSLFRPMGAPFPEGYYSTCGLDQDHLVRWVEDAKRSFENRLDYSLKEPGEVNHEPVPVVNGKEGFRVVESNVRPGDVVELDASASRDPDRDELSYRWYFYPEPSGSENFPELEGSDLAVLQFQIPENARPGSMHLILEVEDSGKPRLKAYRRFVLTVDQ